MAAEPDDTWHDEWPDPWEGDKLGAEVAGTMPEAAWSDRLKGWGADVVAFLGWPVGGFSYARPTYESLPAGYSTPMQETVKATNAAVSGLGNYLLRAGAVLLVALVVGALAWTVLRSKVLKLT